jgi:hypothetical protein
MRRGAMGAVLGLLVVAGPARAADPAATVTAMMTTTTTLSPAQSPQGPSRLILPGQVEGPGPAPTLPPGWLVPSPDAATEAAEQAQVAAELQARFAPALPPRQRFDYDIMPVAAGQDWQRL